METVDSVMELIAGAVFIIVPFYSLVILDTFDSNVATVLVAGIAIYVDSAYDYFDALQNPYQRQRRVYFKGALAIAIFWFSYKAYQEGFVHPIGLVPKPEE